MAKAIQNREAKDKIKRLVRMLNVAGFAGGLYFYKGGECSCCYGLDNTDFQINGNIPSNWGCYDTGKAYYKITYNTDNEERANNFRGLANQMAQILFDKGVKPAENNNSCVIIDIDESN